MADNSGSGGSTGGITGVTQLGETSKVQGNYKDKGFVTVPKKG